MIKPSVNDLCQNNKYNRYTLCVASSKCARIITENTEDSETIGKEVIEKNSALPAEEKPIISAIHKLYEGKYIIRMPEEKTEIQTSDNSSDESADSGNNDTVSE